MMRTVEVVFDGDALRPSRPLALQPKGRYRAKLEERAVSNATGDPLCDWLLRVADRAEHLGGGGLRMTRSVEVIYDGEVLRPQEPLDLEPNTRHLIIIESEPSTGAPVTVPRAIGRILARAKPLGVPDLAEQHDHYLHGTPKR